LHVHGHGARADACGRSFAVLTTQASTVDLRLRLVVQSPMPAAVASRCCKVLQRQNKIRYCKVALHITSYYTIKFDIILNEYYIDANNSGG
jgi:hypothetical protein